MAILWLRRFIRKNFSPIEPEMAMKYKQALSGAYAFFSLNLFVYVIYTTSVKKAEHESFTKNTVDDSSKRAIWWSKNLGAVNPTIIKITGLDLASYEVKKVDSSKKDETTDDLDDL